MVVCVKTDGDTDPPPPTAAAPPPPCVNVGRSCATIKCCQRNSKKTHNIKDGEDGLKYIYQRSEVQCRDGICKHVVFAKNCFAEDAACYEEREMVIPNESSKSNCAKEGGYCSTDVECCDETATKSHDLRNEAYASFASVRQHSQLRCRSNQCKYISSVENCYAYDDPA